MKYEESILRQKRILNFRRHNVLWNVFTFMRIEEFYKKQTDFFKEKNTKSFLDYIRREMHIQPIDVGVFLTGTPTIKDRHKTCVRKSADPDYDERNQVQNELKELHREMASIKSQPFNTLIEHEVIQNEASLKEIEIDKLKEQLANLSLEEDYPAEVQALFERPTIQDLESQHLIKKHEENPTYYFTEHGWNLYLNCIQLSRLIEIHQQELGTLDDKVILHIWKRIKNAVSSKIEVPLQALIKIQ